MNNVTRKTEIAPIDGTPVKRMFWSIIGDYNLKTGLCELIDNPLDFWMLGKRRKPLRMLNSLESSASGVSGLAWHLASK